MGSSFAPMSNPHCPATSKSRPLNLRGSIRGVASEVVLAAPFCRCPSGSGHDGVLLEGTKKPPNVQSSAEEDDTHTQGLPALLALL